LCLRIKKGRALYLLRQAKRRAARNVDDEFFARRGVGGERGRRR
jgi:hypothetical protein